MESAGESAGESRDRLIVEAKRQALLQDHVRARRAIPGGVFLILFGTALTTSVLVIQIGLVYTVFGGFIGLCMIPFGIATLAKAAYSYASTPKKLKELDTLAEARVVSRR